MSVLDCLSPTQSYITTLYYSWSDSLPTALKVIHINKRGQTATKHPWRSVRGREGAIDMVLSSRGRGGWEERGDGGQINNNWMQTRRSVKSGRHDNPKILRGEKLRKRLQHRTNWISSQTDWFQKMNRFTKGIHLQAELFHKTKQFTKWINSLTKSLHNCSRSDYLMISITWSCSGSLLSTFCSGTMFTVIFFQGQHLFRNEISLPFKQSKCNQWLHCYYSKHC